MANNAEIEMRWVNAWNDLYDLTGGTLKCQLPDFSVVSVDDCKAWIQESVYAGYIVHLELGWINGRRGVLASRSKPDDSGI